MPRMTKLEWEVIMDCLAFQDANDSDGRPWGESNDTELTEKQRAKRDDALASAMEKISKARKPRKRVVDIIKSHTRMCF